MSALAPLQLEISPEEAGLSKERLHRLTAAMQQHVAANRIAGGIGLLVRRGKVAYFETYGMADKEAAKPMHKDAIFRIFSMTKAVTGVAVMTLFEEVRLALTDPVSKYLPEFSKMTVAVDKTDPATGQRSFDIVPAERPITILDLLRHTSGINYTGPLDENGELIYNKLGITSPVDDLGFSVEDLVKRLATAPLVHQPATVWDYGFNMDVLGRLVEVLSGKTLDRYFEDRIFKPLEMVDTGFYVPEEKWIRLPALYDPKSDGTIIRSNTPSQERFKHKPVLLLGGAGLTSTTADYLRFLQMLANGGQLDGVSILSPKTVDLMRTDLLGDMPMIGEFVGAGYGFGLTFGVNRGPAHSATIVSKGEYMWGGAAGTAYWIDPSEKFLGLFMIQTLGDLTKAVEFKQLAYQAIV
jgi:CubicO group peptidase (beta-lactamase class C family)